MNYEHTDNNELLPEQTLALASAIAKRNVKENRDAVAYVADILPPTPTPPIEIAQSMEMGATVLKLKAIEDPNNNLDAITASEAIMDNKAIADLLISLNVPPTDEIVQQMRSHFTAALASVIEAFGQPEGMTAFTNSLKVAKEIAAEQNIEVDAVYADGALYEELNRRVFGTPDNFVEYTMNTASKLNKTFVFSIVKGQVEAMLQAEDYTPEEIEEEKAAIMEEMLEDPDIMEQLEQTLVLAQHAAQKLTRREIQRFWGVDASNMLNDESKTRLTTPSVTLDLPRYFADQQKQTDIIAVVCIERGWDPHNLTVKQMAEINALPEMQALRDSTEQE